MVKLELERDFDQNTAAVLSDLLIEIALNHAAPRLSPLRWDRRLVLSCGTSSHVEGEYGLSEEGSWHSVTICVCLLSLLSQCIIYCSIPSSNYIACSITLGRRYQSSVSGSGSSWHPRSPQANIRREIRQIWELVREQRARDRVPRSAVPSPRSGIPPVSTDCPMRCYPMRIYTTAEKPVWSVL